MSSQPSVLVVLSNYRRPNNLPVAIGAWKSQSVRPAHLVVVDNSPTPADEFLPERYPNPLFENADDVWRWANNLGCPARFAPALCLYQYDYTLFADDDLIPGARAIEACLEVAAQLNNQFASIGQHGRIIDYKGPPGKRYVSGNSFRSSKPEVCHLTCRCHMVRTDLLFYMLSFRYSLWNRYRSNPVLSNLLNIHDDILLCLGIQRGTGYRSYTIPTSPDPQRQLILRNLPEDGAVWRRPSHFIERNQMVDICLEVMNVQPLSTPQEGPV